MKMITAAETMICHCDWEKLGYAATISAPLVVYNKQLAARPFFPKNRGHRLMVKNGFVINSYEVQKTPGAAISADAWVRRLKWILS